MGGDVAKCAMRILGIPLINYVIESLNKVNINDINIVVGYKKEDIISVTNHKYNYIIQKNQLGTGDAVKVGLDYIDDDVIILNGDTLILDDDILKDFIEYHHNMKNDFSILSFYKSDSFGDGRIIRKDGFNIVEESYLNGETINECNSGIYISSKKVIGEVIDKIEKNDRGEFYFTDICKYLTGKKVDAYMAKGNICGVNNLYELESVSNLIKLNINNKHLENGVNIMDKNNTYISPDSIIEEDNVIEPGCIIFHSKIGKGNKLLGNCRIDNSVIGDDNTIISSIISDSFIGRANKFGPFCHLRNYANIGNFNRIGNFVEIKDSMIASYTNAAHLAYIGNTDCGSNVNFGCGSITVNYDGKSKHKTVIKDKAFIGCNSNLIAPIVIKENSFIEAGSTITNDVDKDSLAIARARQINKEGYLKNKSPE